MSCCWPSSLAAASIAYLACLGSCSCHVMQMGCRTAPKRSRLDTAAHRQDGNQQGAVSAVLGCRNILCACPEVVPSCNPQRMAVLRRPLCPQQCQLLL
ncbi:hypothetical protein COO60DRAFT_968331 [Scenedesmus sp. NREL 46B-D3]|nr:hypothetical protein COO60DRAFT_968331 [Scenedesmus sp. NREL 46B-D3]